MNYVFEIGSRNVASQREQSKEHVARQIGTFLDQRANVHANVFDVIGSNDLVHQSEHRKVKHILKG